jgi:glycosyltransferase involved in cell wall biosynthesis
MKKLSVIIPFLNEEKTIKTILDKVILVDLSSLDFCKEIILVND